MPIPTVDIIVPVWNNPFEARACLSSILTHSPEARLIVIDNGSNRETQLMLEEFSESLGAKALFMASERNLGLVPAINMGLARSDSDFSVIIRPHIKTSNEWLNGLLGAATEADAGIVTPVFTAGGAPGGKSVKRKCSFSETFSISFNALLLKREMLELIGYFDESMDGGEWCLKDYQRRAWKNGYRTCVTSCSVLFCGEETIYGSQVRRQEQSNFSRSCYDKKWGTTRHYLICFGKEAVAENLADAMELILMGARQGHRFTLLLHRRQAALFNSKGWTELHSGIEVIKISSLMPQRDLRRKLAAIQQAMPDIVPVKGSDSVIFPGADTAITFSTIAETIGL